MTYKTRIVRAARHAHRPGLGLFLLLVLGLLQAAFAQESIYTTKTDNLVTEQTSTDANGNTTTTTGTQTQTKTTYLPSDAQNRLDAWENDPNADQFPYDSTGGAHRNDLDTARKGFDDPRNPWDGRYSNDNPANHQVGTAYDRGEPTTSYRPGDYGTTRVGGRGRGRD